MVKYVCIYHFMKPQLMYITVSLLDLKKVNWGLTSGFIYFGWISLQVTSVKFVARDEFVLTGSMDKVCLKSLLLIQYRTKEF